MNRILYIYYPSGGYSSKIESFNFLVWSVFFSSSIIIVVILHVEEDDDHNIMHVFIEKDVFY